MSIMRRRAAAFAMAALFVLIQIAAPIAPSRADIQTYTVTGIVTAVDPFTIPASGTTTVSLIRYQPGGGWYADPAVPVADDGTFHVDGIAPGMYSLTINTDEPTLYATSMYGGGLGWPVGAPAAMGQPPIDGTFEVSDATASDGVVGLPTGQTVIQGGPAALSGHATAVDSTPLPNAMVDVLAWDASSSTWLSEGYLATDQNGFFRTHRPSGCYTLRITAAGWGPTYGSGRFPADFVPAFGDPFEPGVQCVGVQYGTGNLDFGTVPVKVTTQVAPHPDGLTVADVPAKRADEPTGVTAQLNTTDFWPGSTSGTLLFRWIGGVPAPSGDAVPTFASNFSLTPQPALSPLIPGQSLSDGSVQPIEITVPAGVPVGRYELWKITFDNGSQTVSFGGDNVSAANSLPSGLVNQGVDVIDTAGKPLGVYVNNFIGAPPQIIWDGPSDIGNSELSAFVVTAYHDGQPVASQTARPANPFNGGGQTSVTGLLAGSSYIFGVRAVNAAGSGPEADSGLITLAQDTTQNGQPLPIRRSPGLSPGSSLPTRKLILIASAKTVKRGAVVVLKGDIRDPAAVARGELQVLRGTKWVTVSSLLTSSKGTYSKKVKLSSKGTRTFRVLMRSTSTFAETVSKSVTVKVR